MRSRGFTLVEMLVVMTISAILIAAAVPSLQWMVARNRISDATNLLLSDIEFARLEAARRGSTVAICRRSIQTRRSPPLLAAALRRQRSTAMTGPSVGSYLRKSSPTPTRPISKSTTASFFAAGFGGRARVIIHSNIGGAERLAYLPRGTGGFIGSGRLPSPMVNRLPCGNRALTALALDGGARCIPMSLLGSLRVTRPSGGVCP